MNYLEDGIPASLDAVGPVIGACYLQSKLEAFYGVTPLHLFRAYQSLRPAVAPGYPRQLPGRGLVLARATETASGVLRQHRISIAAVELVTLHFRSEEAISALEDGLRAVHAMHILSDKGGDTAQLKELLGKGVTTQDVDLLSAPGRSRWEPAAGVELRKRKKMQKMRRHRGFH